MSVTCFVIWICGVQFLNYVYIIPIDREYKGVSFPVANKQIIAFAIAIYPRKIRIDVLLLYGVSHNIIIWPIVQRLTGQVLIVNYRNNMISVHARSTCHYNCRIRQLMVMLSPEHEIFQIWHVKNFVSCSISNTVSTTRVWNNGECMKTCRTTAFGKENRIVFAFYKSQIDKSIVLFTVEFLFWCSPTVFPEMGEMKALVTPYFIFNESIAGKESWIYHIVTLCNFYRFSTKTYNFYNFSWSFGTFTVFNGCFRRERHIL